MIGCLIIIRVEWREKKTRKEITNNPVLKVDKISKS